jgi:hypothetical protein
MRTPTSKEVAALTRQDDVGAAEMNREQWWHMLPAIERERAVGVAGMARERAYQPLATFSDADRARIRAAIFSHVTNMELIARCMAASNTNVHGWLH